MPRGGKKGQASADAEVAADSSEVAFPVPAPLEGVKSRKKPIFKVDQATAGSQKVSGISVTLDSRILAVGQVGQTIVSLLLDGDSTVAKTPAPLNVARLGPHLAGVAASAEAHKAAISEAVKSKPQVVVLEERLGDGGLAWAEVFHGLLRSAALRAFKGAIIVAACQETFLLREVCSERWIPASQATEIRQEAVVSKYQISREVFDGARPGSVDAGSPSRKRGGARGGASSDGNAELRWAAASLFEVMFEEDMFEKIQKEGWKVSLLTETGSDDNKHLLGLICYSLERAELYIHRVAVQLHSRGRGHGKILMQWLLEEVVRMPTSQCTRIACSALDNVIPFYEKFGFTVCDRPEEHKLDEDDGSDPQTYMELPNASLVGAVGA